MKITTTVILFGSVVLSLLLSYKPKIETVYVQPDMTQYVLKAEHDRQIDRLNKMNEYQAAKDMKTIMNLKAKLETK